MAGPGLPLRRCCFLVLAACSFDGTGSGKGEETGFADETAGESDGSGSETRGDSDGEGSGEGSGSGDGDGCSMDGDCPMGFVCQPPACINPDEGKDCATDFDCTPLAPHCGPGQACHDGSAGDPCWNSLGCAEAPYCVDSACREGHEGDPCVTSFDCDPMLAPVCGPDGMCHDGSAGDPCLTDFDCQVACTDGTCD